MSEIELQDAILRHSLQILRLSAGEQAVVDEIMRQLEVELRQLLHSRNVSSATKAELEALIEDARTIVDPAYRSAAASVDTHQLALIVAEKTAHLVEGVSGATIGTPTAERLASLTKDVIIDGAPSSAWWEKQGEDTTFKFAQQVRQGVINGETNERIVQRVVGKGGEPGIMEVARRNARALVQSSVMTAANQARLETFRRNAALIKGVRWLATLDGHTCPRCAALDGQAWDLDGKKLPGTEVNFQAPPIHWNDRCVLSPIAKTFRDIGLDLEEPDAGARASSNGQVHGATTFNDFLHRQSPAFVDKTLGKGRAALFRAGKITVRDLVSGTGRELTLEELGAH